MNPSCVRFALVACAVVVASFSFASAAIADPDPAKLPGACCERCQGACFTVNDPSECLGAFFAGGSCEPNACDQMADCCLPDGSCIITMIRDCIAAGGGGFTGSPCGPTSCQGACCTFEGACTVSARIDCFGYFELLAGCDPPACDGACCLFDGSCTAAATPEVCQGNFFIGASCAPDPCPPCPVACCRADGTCFITIPDVCFDTNGGEILPQPVCAPAACQGACCLADGSCAVILRSACDLADPNRTWNGAGSTCAQAGCSGACCAPDFSCSITGPNACQFPSNYLGGGTVCDPGICNPPVFACCRLDFSCVLSTECDCLSTGGAFFFDVTCAAFPCAESYSIGACCYGGKPETCMITTSLSCNGNFSDGLTCEDTFCNFQPVFACCCFDTCILTNPGQCNGVSFFNVTTCSPNPCGPGSCCDPLTGLCQSLPYPSLCFGNYTVGQACAPNPCPPPPTGACCDRDTDACTIAPFIPCVENNNGLYRGDGTVCTPTICGGACCLPPVHGGVGSVCSILTRPDCAAAGGTHAGLFTTCGFAFNLTTCCRANFNGFGGLSVQDLFDFLAAYFSNNPRADFNNSGSISVQDIFDFLAAYFSGCRVV